MDLSIGAILHLSSHNSFLDCSGICGIVVLISFKGLVCCLIELGGNEQNANSARRV